MMNFRVVIDATFCGCIWMPKSGTSLQAMLILEGMDGPRVLGATL